MVVQFKTATSRSSVLAIRFEVEVGGFHVVDVLGEDADAEGTEMIEERMRMMAVKDWRQSTKERW